MKRIFIFTISLFIAFSFFSCKKFLDTKPVSQGIASTGTDSVVFKTAAAVESALAGVYSGFKNEYFELDYFLDGDAQSDNCYAGADNPSIFQIDDLKLDATNSIVSRDWGYLYSIIGNANRVINNVDSVPDPTLSAERKNQIHGEACFIRAFMYFQLVQLWGDVPLQLKEVSTISAKILPEIYPLLFPPRVPMAVVYTQIIADLETAHTNLLTAPLHLDNKGYVTIGAVNALLAQVYATKVTNDSHEWEKVRGYCDSVIAGGYSLMPNYNDLWDNNHKNCAESIFEINYSGGSSDGNWGASMFRGFDWKKFNIPSNDLVKAFDQEQDTSRKNASIIFLDVTGHWSDIYWPQTHYPFVNKYRNFASGSDQNYIFIRLADVLLLKAEALNELGELQGAADLVNQIRTRALLPNTTAGDQASIRLAIEKERLLELAFEGRRWFDLKRTGRAIEVMNNAKGVNDVSLGYNLTQNRLVWPIPQAEMDINTSLTQNPGY